MTRRGAWIFVAGSLLAGGGMAQTPDASEPTFGSSTQSAAIPLEPLWEAGVVALGVSQQAYPGSDQQVSRAIALPYVLYRGSWLRADRGTVGLRALKTSRYEFDVGFAAALGSQANDIEARRGMADLGTLVEAGPRIKWLVGPPADPARWRIEVPLRGVFDLSDSLAYRGLALAPALAFQHQVQGWTHEFSVGALLGSRRLNAMYYGVAPSEATAQRVAYSAQAGLVSWRLQTSVSRSIGPQWHVFAFARLDSVAGAANLHSPLVRQRNGASVGIGVAWSGWRSVRPAVD